MNEEKFTGKADNYDKYRPSYPEELIDWLYEKTAAKTVADIGAGTGKFTACLTTKPWKITAVEPNGDMLEKLRVNVPKAEIIQAPAEKTGIVDNSVDLVTTAQAFHWFDKSRFKIECERILVPDGRLAVIWNERSEGRVSRERTEISKKYCPLFRTGHVETGHSVQCGDNFLRNDFFAEAEYFSIDNPIFMSMEHFIGDTLSRSYALDKNDEQYNVFISELSNAFDKYQKDGFVTVEYKTTCYLGKF